jgi:hypothetical protein
MPSPFPGMNPYLEQEDVWHDFHESFMPQAREFLASQLPAHYLVKIDEHLYIHEPSSDRSSFLGREDVLVADRRSSPDRGVQGATLQAPTEIVLPIADVERVSFLEIRDRRDRQLVTVLELLSPSNKYRGPDREQYLGKRGQLLSSAVHLVELDFLRGGPRMPFATPLPACDYYALVSRMDRRPHGEIWPIRLRDPLPPIPIPLSEDDPDVQLDLQAVLHRVYDAARYGNYIYEGTPQPALGNEDAAWAQEILASRPV